MGGAPALLQLATIGRTHEAFLLPFARYFRSLGWRVDGAASGIVRISECVESYDRVFEIEWSRNPLDPRNAMRAASQVRSIVEQGEYDLVHVHTPVAAFVGRYALKGLRRQQRVKVLYTAHGFHFHSRNTPAKNLVFRGIEQLSSRWTDVLIVINREDEMAARRYGLASLDRIEYVPGIGIDTEAYSPSAVAACQVHEVRSQLGLRQGVPLFLMVAEFNRGKRQRDAVDALSSMRIGREAAHLALAGEGPLMDEVRAQVRRLGLERRVHFLGHRRDIPVLMRASTATIMPSEREGLNRSVMESLALEVPVIGSDARGVADLLIDGSGIVVPVGDSVALATAMAWVTDHPKEAQAMAKAGRRHIVKHCDVRKIMGRHERIYTRLLGKDFSEKPEGTRFAGSVDS